MPRMLAPQCRTATVDTDSQRSHALPASMLNDQVRRLAICAAVGAALWAYGLFMEAVVRPATLGSPVQAKIIVVETLSIAVSAMLLMYVRYSSHAAPTKIDAALVYFVLNAGAVALLNSWRHAPISAIEGLVSWNAVVILVAAMIIPATPMKILVASLLAASTDPLAVWAAHLRGADVPSASDALVLFMPNYACAAVAVLPSRVLQRLGRTLKQAQDMGSYQLVELLGRGGMGEVWRASHRLLARGAAVKLVRPELIGAASPKDVESMVHRFRREAEATAALNSPHTIRLFDFGVTENNTFYYVMERLSGQALETLIRTSGPLPAERVVFLMRQVCHSLAEAHAQGLVHRDITPRNIYACRMGLDFDFVKVLDFGLVSYTNRPVMNQTLILAGPTTTGTPAFMAPEVILEGAVDARADIYAFGCVTYYLLTGELVFEADTPMKMFADHLQTAPVPPSQRCELPIPEELDTLVLECLAKDPASRPPSADDLLRRLDRLTTKNPWTNQQAREWWETHLVELAAVNRQDSAHVKTTLAVAS